MEQKIYYNINELADALGTTTPAIHAHLRRKNFDAVPQPQHLGRRLVWRIKDVEEWADQKTSTPMP